MTHGDAPARKVRGSHAYLPSRLAVLERAIQAVSAVEDAADRLRVALGVEAACSPVDTERVAAAYSSDRLLRLDGEPVNGFAPLSGFFPAADGWVRTHANYPHHAERLRRLLRLGPDAGRERVAAAITSRSAGELEIAAAAVGALVVQVRSHEEWVSGEQSRSLLQEPLVRLSSRPGSGAGTRGRPVARHTGADVLVTGYRPGALDRLGLARPPRLVEASIDAWGASGPWRQRRGFDSLVQAASGIAVIEGSPDQPGALPAQALDHTSGYLLAASILDALAQQIAEPGAHRVAVSLARVSAHLVAAGRHPKEPGALVPGESTTVTRLLNGTEVTTARPALSGYDDYPFPAHRLGSDRPVWGF